MTEASRRVLLTGGAGCLGSNLCERFLDTGHSVAVIDNYATGAKSALPPADDRLTIVEGTIADEALVGRLFRDFGPTHVVHCAAAYKDPDDWPEDIRTNVEGTAIVARAAGAAGVRRFLNFHTALGYGRPEALPIPADAPTRPFTSYGISKQAAESYLFLSNLKVVSLRLANVTGPRLAIGPIPTFYQRLRSGKSCFCSRTIRDFVDMDDFFDIVDLALQDEAPTGIFNVSTGTGHSIREIFDIVVDHLGVTLDAPVAEVDPGPDDVPAVVLDPSLTKTAFGWSPRYSFEQTLRRMLAWYDRHGVSTIYSHLKSPPSSPSR